MILKRSQSRIFFRYFQREFKTMYLKIVSIGSQKGPFLRRLKKDFSRSLEFLRGSSQTIRQKKSIAKRAVNLAPRGNLLSHARARSTLADGGASIHARAPRFNDSRIYVSYSSEPLTLRRRAIIQYLYRGKRYIYIYILYILCCCCCCASPKYLRGPRAFVFFFNGVLSRGGEWSFANRELDRSVEYYRRVSTG